MKVNSKRVRKVLSYFMSNNSLKELVLMERAMRRISLEEQIYNLNTLNHSIRGTLIEIHIADIHFGAIDPKYQYDILEEQFLNKIKNIDFDLVSIDGDLFDHKYMSNSDVVMYASLFINNLVKICSTKNATLVILHGTSLHDAGQLKLFYHYLKDPTIDIRIVEKVQFEYVKGAKILCIPELYNMGADYYIDKLFLQGEYDSVFMHGVIKGAIYQAKNQESGIHSEKAPTFTIEDFGFCNGPIISGHVHVPGCFSTYFYYCGSPYRWKHGEEQEKGFLIVTHNLDTHEHYVHLEPIKSYTYKTINLDDIIMNDPKDVIEYVNILKENGIDYIRIDFDKLLSNEELVNLNIVKSYYRNRSDIKIKYDNKKIEDEKKANKEINDKYKDLDFLMDKGLSDEQKLTMYINYKEKCEYITVEELIDILEDK